MKCLKEEGNEKNLEKKKKKLKEKKTKTRN